MKYLQSCLMSLLLTTGALGTSSFNASLVPDVAIHKRTETIDGITIGIWGENPQHAFALMFVAGSTKESAGFSWSLVNYGESYTGVLWAIVNYSKEHFVGWQSGLVNYAGKLTGLQFGLVNIAAQAEKGVQIGLVNIIEDNKSWFGHFPNQVAPGMIIANWHF